MNANDKENVICLATIRLIYMWYCVGIILGLNFTADIKKVRRTRGLIWGKTHPLNAEARSLKPASVIESMRQRMLDRSTSGAFAHTT